MSPDYVYNELYVKIKRKEYSLEMIVNTKENSNNTALIWAS